MTRFFRFLLTLTFLTTPLMAQFGAFGGASSVATMLPENTSIAPGKSFTIALKLTHPEKWHSYYKNSGGVEKPPFITWELPQGFTASEIHFPVPEVKDGFFGKSFIYQGSPVFLIDIAAPADLKTGESITLKAKADWQICMQACISESKSFTLTLPVTATAEPDATVAELFTEARAALPKNVPALTTSATTAGETVQLRVGPASSTGDNAVDFIPDQKFLKPASDGGNITRDGDDWLVTLQRNTVDPIDETQPIPQGDSFSGILTGTTDVLIPETKIGAMPAAPVPATGFFKILGGMFIGGLILNLMPCVFPVIGLKIMGFVQQAGEDRKKIILHGVLFALGVLASFGVISGILFAARETVGSVGWGYQLQNPWVVLSLMLLMFVLALNMYGVFEMGTSATSVGGSLQNKQGLAGSFFSGVLATVLATPCSAPFLGVAIAAAIALPAIPFFTAFAAMALGLALPYLILSIFPKLIKFLPRPGAWMESFKQAMSFLLFATAGYLLWIYGAQIDFDNLLNPILGLSSIAVAAWIYGRWFLPHKSSRVRSTAVALTLAFAVGGFWLAKPPTKSALVWETWSSQRVEELLAEGSPVFIDFTAKWCATCQVNKKVAYTDQVIALMKQKGIVALKGDKTNPDPEIEKMVHEYGRAAIPVNVLLEPNKQPVVTPEVLTPGYLTDLFGKLPDK
ncbi:MAG: protein-disulfide reductase DsbD domain-containing protein [Verrucomicrobiota bacterium]